FHVTGVQTCALPIYSQVISPRENTHQVTASSGDAIQQFVHAGFSERRTMLNQWPASIEELDRLVAYVDNNELYTDGSGHTYILRSEERRVGKDCRWW